MKMSKGHLDFIAHEMAVIHNGILDRVSKTNNLFYIQFVSSYLPILANRLAETNPNFNKEKFIKKCMEEIL